jgi:glutathione S-transferase
MVHRIRQPPRAGTYTLPGSHKPKPTNTPRTQVPAITYGGPAVPPDQPSPESIKLAESRVLVEFIAELYPASQLLPSSPVLRARARLFITRFTPHTDAIRPFIASGAPGTRTAFLDAIDAVQRLLPDDSKGEGRFAVGEEFTVADVIVMPAVGLLETVFDTGIAAFEEGEGREVAEVLKGEKYARWARYCEVLKGRESFKKLFNEVGLAFILSFFDGC